MKRISSFLFLLSFITACTSPAPSTTQQVPTVILQPTIITDMVTPPAPETIDAPLVESPSIISLEMFNEKDGWAITEQQILRTNDGGVTWHNLTPPKVNDAGYSVRTFFLDTDHAWVLVADPNNYPNGGTLHRTTDGGLSWIPIAAPFSGGDLTFLDPNNGWIMADLGSGAGSEGIAVFQTTDGGSNWTRNYTNDPNEPGAGNSLPLGGIKFGLTPLNMQTAWIGGVIYSDGTLYLYRTDDSGKTWNQVSMTLPAGAEKAEISVERLQFVSPANGYLVLRMTSDVIQIAIYVTQDGGNTWTLTPTLIPKGGSEKFLSATEAIVYNGDQFYVTRDAARTWTIIPPDIVFGDTFAGMDFISTSIGWVLTSDVTNHRSLYRTEDGGATWSPVVP